MPEDAPRISAQRSRSSVIVLLRNVTGSGRTWPEPGQSSLAARSEGPSTGPGIVAPDVDEAPPMNLPSIDPQVIALVIPVILLQLGLLVAAIVDLLRDDRAVRGGNKGLWAVVIVFVNLIGPILYFLVGRVDG